MNDEVIFTRVSRSSDVADFAWINNIADGP